MTIGELSTTESVIQLQPQKRQSTQEVRARYVVPLFVLIAMLASTLGAAWVLRPEEYFFSGIPISNFSVQAFLFAGVFVSVGVFFVLLRFTASREAYFYRLSDLERQLAEKNAEVERRNVNLESTTSEQANELRDRLTQLEQSRTAMVSLLEDLTESRDAVVKSRAYEQAIFASIADGIIATDADGIVVQMNRAAATLLGISVDVARGKRLADVLVMRTGADEAVADSSVLILESVNRSGRFTSKNYTLKTVGGKMFPVSAEAAPIRTADQTYGVVVVFRDITEEIRIDRAKSEFVSLASHQLRTPLTAIGWYAELLLSDAAPRLSDEEKNSLHEIAHANRRMVSLVDSLLNVSRIEMGSVDVRPNPINLEVFVHDEVSGLAPLISSRNLTVQTDFMPGLPLYPADPKVMSIIIQNLLSNAVKYSQHNGTIVVRLAKDKHEVTLSVSDDGIGIPKDVQGKVFNKLFRADNALLVDADGSGLGLYLVKSLVDQVGGSITFTSEEGRGTTFVVHLPEYGMRAHVGVRPIVTPTPTEVVPRV